MPYTALDCLYTYYHLKDSSTFSRIAQFICHNCIFIHIMQQCFLKYFLPFCRLSFLKNNLFDCIWSQLQHAGSFIAVYRLSSHGTWASVVVGSGLCCSKACGTLVPQPGIESRSPALQDSKWTTREISDTVFFNTIFQSNFRFITKLRGRYKISRKPPAPTHTYPPLLSISLVK